MFLYFRFFFLLIFFFKFLFVFCIVFFLWLGCTMDVLCCPMVLDRFYFHIIDLIFLFNHLFIFHLCCFVYDFFSSLLFFFKCFLIRIQLLTRMKIWAAANHLFGSKMAYLIIVWICQHPVHDVWRPLRRNPAARVSCVVDSGGHKIRMGLIVDKIWEH